MARYGNRYEFEQETPGPSIFQQLNETAGDTLSRLRQRGQEEESQRRWNVGEARANRTEGREVTQERMGNIERGWRPDSPDADPSIAGASVGPSTGAPAESAAPGTVPIPRMNASSPPPGTGLGPMGPTAAAQLEASRRNRTSTGNPALYGDDGQVPSHDEVKAGGWRLDPSQTPGALADTRERGRLTLESDLIAGRQKAEFDRTQAQKTADEEEEINALMAANKGMSKVQATASVKARRSYEDSPAYIQGPYTQKREIDLRTSPWNLRTPVGGGGVADRAKINQADRSRSALLTQGATQQRALQKQLDAVDPAGIVQTAAQQPGWQPKTAREKQVATVFAQLNKLRQTSDSIARRKGTSPDTGGGDDLGADTPAGADNEGYQQEMSQLMDQVNRLRQRAKTPQKQREIDQMVQEETARIKSTYLGK